MAFFGLFKKSRKPNLVPDIPRPTQEDLALTQPLREMARRRISGQDVGFGPDFLDKATNPAIANIDANFNNRTKPLLDSELSKRGVARSAGAGLATDIIGQADQQRNRDVNELMSKFFVLNESQKKADVSEGINLGQNLNREQAGLLSDRAAASERVRDLTVGRADTLNKRDEERNMKAVTAILGAATGGASGGFTGALSGASSAVGSSSKANVLGNLDDDMLEKIYKALGGT